MKKICFIILIIFPIIFFSGCNKSPNTSNIKNIEISRTGTVSNDTSLNILVNNSINENTSNNNENVVNNTTTNENIANNTTNETINENTTKQEQAPPAQTETVLYEFSTTIKSKSSNRLNNIRITCSKLNGTIVEPQKEFSFCKTIGKTTEEKGYKKADVIINKEVTQALGGGNCQVSSTLYNAVLGIPDLKVTERHPHGKKVNYVPEGKDAAVSYGSKDFKFINNTKNSIKIYASTDNSNVYIKIVSLK